MSDSRRCVITACAPLACAVQYQGRVVIAVMLPVHIGRAKAFMRGCASLQPQTCTCPQCHRLQPRRHQLIQAAALTHITKGISVVRIGAGWLNRKYGYGRTDSGLPRRQLIVLQASY